MKIKVNDVNEASWRDMQVKSNLPENLRKLAFSKQVAKPKQLLLWESHE